MLQSYKTFPIFPSFCQQLFYIYAFYGGYGYIFVFVNKHFTNCLVFRVSFIIFVIMKINAYILGKKRENLSQIDFWKLYFKLVNVVNDQELSDAEINMISTILSKDYNKTYFAGPYAKELIRDCKLSRQYFYLLKKKLLEKNLLVPVSDAKNDILPHKNLRNLQYLIKTSDNTLNLNISIDAK